MIGEILNRLIILQEEYANIPRNISEYFLCPTVKYYSKYSNIQCKIV